MIGTVPVSLSCIWGPVFFGHSMAVHFTTSKSTRAGELCNICRSVAEIEVINPSDTPPTAVTKASGKDVVSVGRIRSDLENTTDFSLWAVADNLRFGIAGNAVKIAGILVKDYL